MPGQVYAKNVFYLRGNLIMNERKKIAVILTGGTIACVFDKDNKSHTMDLSEKVQSVISDPGIEVDAIPFQSLKGYDMRFEDLLHTTEKVQELLASDWYDGFVIVMGTNLMEEAAFCLECLIHTDLPIVVTGSMRTPQAPSEDGTANLIAAIRTAASTQACGLGITVLMDDTLHSAYYVRKEHTMLTGAFTSDFPLGYIAEGRLSLRTRPVRRNIPRLHPSDLSKNVCLYTVSLGDNGSLLPYISAAGYDGLVFEGSGGGNMPEKILDILEELHKTIPVVIASRTGHGDVMRSTYGVGYGRPSDLIERGYLNAGQLDGRKARVLLALLLMSGADDTMIRASFDLFS